MLLVFFVAIVVSDGNRCMWDLYRDKPISVLYGHHYRISNVAFNEGMHQVISLSCDKVWIITVMIIRRDEQTMKVWDTRMWKCIDTITDERTLIPENTISSVAFDEQRRCLVTCSNALSAWPVCCIALIHYSVHRLFVLWMRTKVKSAICFL